MHGETIVYDCCIDVMVREKQLSTDELLLSSPSVYTYCSLLLARGAVFAQVLCTIHPV